MSSGFSHFYCHRVVLSTQKNFEVFFYISGRPAAARWSPTAKNIVSGPLVQPQRPVQNLDHQRPVPSLLQESFEASNSSLAWSSGELSQIELTPDGDLMHFLQFSNFGVKWCFWAITLILDMLEGQSRTL